MALILSVLICEMGALPPTPRDALWVRGTHTHPAGWSVGQGDAHPPHGMVCGSGPLAPTPRDAPWVRGTRTPSPHPTPAGWSVGQGDSHPPHRML